MKVINHVAQTPSKAKPDLTSVTEVEETPVTQVQTPSRKNKTLPEHVSTPKPAPKTPVSSALKPPHDEMHPSHARPNMAAPNSALGLGFTDINNMKETGPAGTPSKVPQSAFSFRVNRDAGEGNVEPSENAQRMMDAIREQASKIKADLVAKRLAEDEVKRAGRKIAQPKPKAGRFSAAHMAEFKKMDSIEGHASLWRYEKAAATPLNQGLKRSPSKANLDGTPTSVRSTLKRSSSKANLDDAPAAAKPSLKRSSSRANLDDKPEPSAKKTDAPASPTKPTPSRLEAVSSFAKRLKQRQEDDASTTRQTTQDDAAAAPASARKFGFSQSQSQSALGRLTSPTKASQGHAARKPAVSGVPSPTKSAAGGIPKSATTGTLATPSKASELRRRIVSPGRFQKVKSILRGHGSQTPGDKSAIPKLAPQVSQTPAPAKVGKELPPAPLTTPRRKLVKHVAFTPDTRAAATQDSPSPQKMAHVKGFENAESIQYPTVGGVSTQGASDNSESSGDVAYPDLSALHALTHVQADEQADEQATEAESRPGTFTFRSDHTIKFEDASASFGASPGQSSIRRVRGSIKPTEMPGAFPDASVLRGSHPDKENKAPTPAKLIPGAPHGMSNKKRHRPSSDEDDAEREASERAAKKRRGQDVPEGEALLAPRLLTGTPRSAMKSAKKTPSRRLGNRTPGSATPSKRPGISMSRLNMLAQPKNRA